MNTGQMLFDVRLAVQNDDKIEFLGKPGGEVFSPKDIYEKAIEIFKK
jgi:2-oxoglutarate ferredoxin oxidoreductase subunit alpha